MLAETIRKEFSVIYLRLLSTTYRIDLGSSLFFRFYLCIGGMVNDTVGALAFQSPESISTGWKH